MQLTRIDRWLIEEFVHETHIHTLRPPVGKLPRGVREVPVPEVQGRRYNHHYIAKNPRAADALALALRDNGQMFSTQVSNRRSWYVPLIAPAGKSITWRIIWAIFFTISATSATAYVHHLWSDLTFRENFIQAIRTLAS